MSAARAVHVGSSVALAVGITVFLTTVGSENREVRGAPEEGPPRAAVAAPGYSGLRAMRRGPNADLYLGAVSRLASELPDASLDAEPLSQERRLLRAYEGAPPVIPHGIAPDSVNDCLACHEKGAKILGKIAPPMRHPRRESCTQCHVPDTVRERAGTARPAPPPLTSSTFVGYWSTPEGGPRP